MSYSLLIVDDDDSFVKITKLKLEKHFSGDKIKIYTAQDGKVALRLIKSIDIDIVLADINMPAMSGLELLEETRLVDKNIKFIMVSADHSLADIRQAMNSGAFDFLLKPVDFDDLFLTVLKSINEVEAQQLLEGQLENSYKKLKQTVQEIVHAISTMEEMRDPYTAGHMRRVAQLAKAIAIEMDLSVDKVESIYMAGCLHDIGKICVPSEILTKPGMLTKNELHLVRDHAQAGYSILKMIDFPWPIADIVRMHHEKLDGSGYPQGLKSDEILLESKILSVADVMEATAYHRPYRPALGHNKGVDVLKAGRGIFFDAEIVDICLELFSSKRFVFSKNDFINFVDIDQCSTSL